MIAKILAAVVATALALMAVRMLTARAERAKVRARRPSNRPDPVELIEDPETGVFRPRD